MRSAIQAFVVIGLFAQASCLFDPVVPVSATILCGNDTECPEGMICAAALGRCVGDTLDRDAPGLTVEPELTPSTATTGTEVRLTLQVDEPLGADPTANLDGGRGGAFTLVEEESVRETSLFTLTYVVTGGEEPGPHAVSVTLVDRLGNQTGVVAGTLTLDFRPPGLSSTPSVVPSSIAAGRRAALSLTFDEDLGDAPEVRMRPVGQAQPEILFTVVAGGSARQWDASYVAVGDEPGGRWDIVALGQDAAGNRSLPLPAGRLELDFAAPTLVSLTVEPQPAAPGDLVVISATLDEAVVTEPLLWLDDPVSDSLEAPVAASAGLLVYRVLVDVPDGVYPLSLLGLEDEAGNTLAALPVGSLQVDGTAPLLTSWSQEPPAGTRLNAADTLRVTFDVTEPLLTTPSVSVGDAVMTMTSAPGTRPYTFALDVAGSGLSGEFGVIVRTTDAVGNQGVQIGGRVLADAIPPSLGATGILFSPSTARSGVTALLTVVADEVLQAPPVVEWEQDDPGFTVAANLSSGLTTNFRLSIGPDIPQQTYRVTAVNLVDIAGNTSRVVLPAAVPFSVESDCADGLRDGGDGNCVAPGSCSPGFHDGGSGDCVPVGRCLAGFHDGGDGRCVEQSLCAAAFHDGGAGTCVPADTCSNGFHDGGDGSCLPFGECVAPFHNGGAGVCVPPDTCSPRFHQGGNGICVLEGTCVAGFHDGGDLTCVPFGSCSSGFNDGGDGRCVDNGTCSPGFRDGGDGQCRVVGVCSAGFINGGDGACVAVGTCSAGFQNGGDGRCVLAGTCSAGFHDGGDGQCVTLGACRPGFHNGGDGKCTALDRCSSGFRLRSDGGCHPPAAPVATAQTLLAYNGGAQRPITLTATDADNDPVTFFVSSPPTRGQLIVAMPLVVYIADASYRGPDAFSFVASDGTSLSAPATVSITVSDLVAPSCSVHKQRNPAAVDGLFSVDPDGPGGRPPANVFCDMTTDGGGWEVMSLLRSPAHWNIGLFADAGTLGDPAGFAAGAQLSSQGGVFNEKIVIYKNLVENGVSLGKQFMVNSRSNLVPFANVSRSDGWGYRDSFNFNDATVANVCSHGCSTYRGFGMFHDFESGFGFSGTQGGDNGCRDGNNICWMARSDGCNVGNRRCALLTGANEGVIYGVRRAQRPPAGPANPTIVAGNGELRLSWQAASSDPLIPVTSHRVFRREAGQATPVLIRTLIGPAVLSIIDTAVVNGVRYFYTVRGVSSLGEGPPSAEVSATPFAPPPPFVVDPVRDSCFSYVQQGASQGDGIYPVDRDGPGPGPQRLVACDMTTDGGGWEILAVLRNPRHWDGAIFADTGVLGDTVNGFAAGASLSQGGGRYTEKIIIYNALVENGAALGKQFMINARNDPVPFSQITTDGGWSYRDSFGFSDDEVDSVCSHGCSTFRGFGMFHGFDNDGFGFCGTQTSDLGCRDGNNICWMPRGDGCNVGNRRCANLINDGEGVIYAVRAKPQPPGKPRDVVATPGDGVVFLSWSPPAGADASPITAYVVRRGTSPGAATDVVSEGQDLFFTDSPIQNGVRFFYVVTATNALGEGPPSVEVSTRPRPDPVIIDTGGVVLGSCADYVGAGLAQGDGLYVIARGGQELPVYCEMTTDGGGWEVLSYLRSPEQWDIGVTEDHGVVGDVLNGFASGGTLSSLGGSVTEKIVIYKSLEEFGTPIGQAFMVNGRGDPLPVSELPNVGFGWSYRDSFGFADPVVEDTCSHGCGSFRTFGMFHGFDNDGFGFCGTQGGDEGCRDGNNICWMPRAGSCSVGSERCALMTGDDEGVVFAVRTAEVPPGPAGALTAIARSSGIEVAWNPAAGATGYTVWRATASEPEQPIASLSDLTFLDADVAVGLGVMYRVVPFNAFGDGVVSAPASVVRGAAPFFSEDADDGTSAPPWNSDRIAGAPSGRAFIGQFDNETLELQLDNLPEHTAVVVDFDLIIAESWEGNRDEDAWALEVDGVLLARHTFAVVPGETQSYPAFIDPLGSGGAHGPGTAATQNNALGFGFFGDSVYHVSYLLPHSASAVQVRMIGQGLQGVGDEGWGIDDLRLTLQQPPGPPGPPQQVRAFLAATDGIARIAWRAPAFDGLSPISEYQVTRSVDGGVETSLGTTTGLRFEDPGAPQGVPVEYRVTAVNAFGPGVPSAAAVLVVTPTGILQSCRDLLDLGQVGDGVFPLDPDGDGLTDDVVCDQTTDDGGWTLVSSSNAPPQDSASLYDSNLATLSPEVPMAGVWNGLRDFTLPTADVRFACRVDPLSPGFDVDLSFYDVDFYGVITTGTDEESCFQVENGNGFNGPWDRRNNITGETRTSSDPWSAGFMEGEDGCGDTSDFTVDFEDRGMDNNESDGTDWGEDDGNRKCGTTQGSQWFIFVRER